MAWLFACLTLILAGCTDRPSSKPPPRVVDGVLDVSGWDFEHDGPVKLEGDWEVIPEGTIEGEAVRSAPASGDFVSVPWSEGHHQTRSGRDVDESRWVQLRVRIIGAEPAQAFVLEAAEELAEAFFVECRGDAKRSTVARAGIASPRSATTFRDALWPHAALQLSGNGRCALTVPRAAMERVRLTSALAFDDATFAPRRAQERARMVHANLAMMLTFVVFAATMVATQRHDTVARWSLVGATLLLARIVVVNRGLLFSLGDGGRLDTLPWWRVEYVTLWLLCIACLRYGEELADRRARGRSVVVSSLLAATGLACVAAYSPNKVALPANEVAGVIAWALTLQLVFSATPTRAIVLARIGIAVAVVGGIGSVIALSRTGSNSRAFEALASTEPFFQMAVLAVRAQEARESSRDLAISRELLDALLEERTLSLQLAYEQQASTNVAISRFVPAQFLHELGHSDVTTAKLGDAASRHVTVLFADIRNFTAMSERMTPAETFAFLNACLSRIGPHIRANGGFVDKYIGDAIMALFPKNPSDAIRATVAMQQEVEASNARHPERRPLAIGVGIHVGDVMMGTIGEAERFEATVISDTVNLTARLESLTKQLGCSVLLSGDVFAALDAELREHTRRLGSFVVKGKAQAVDLYELFASDSPALRESKIATRGTFEELLAAYVSGNTFRALDLATELRDACPDDGPANWWFMRLAKECADDAVPSFNGAVVLDAK